MLPHQDLERDTGLMRHERDDLRRVTSSPGKGTQGGQPDRPVVAQLMEPLRKSLQDLENVL